MRQSFSFSVFTNIYMGNNKHVHTSVRNAMHTDTIRAMAFHNYLYGAGIAAKASTLSHSFIISELATFIFEQTNERTNEWTFEQKMHRIAFSTTIPFPQHEISITFHWICTQKHKTSAQCRCNNTFISFLKRWNVDVRQRWRATSVIKANNLNGFVCVYALTV